MSMSREELLEHHIYVPNVVDDRIKAHLLMGDSVLVWGSHVNYIGRSLRRIMLCDTPYPKSDVMQLYLCVDGDLEDVCEYEDDIVSTNYVMWDLLLNREDVENIKDMFYD